MANDKKRKNQQTKNNRRRQKQTLRLAKPATRGAK